MSTKTSLLKVGDIVKIIEERDRNNGKVAKIVRISPCPSCRRQDCPGLIVLEVDSFRCYGYISPDRFALKKQSSKFSRIRDGLLCQQDF